MKSSFVVAIPARYASTRFPGKALALVGGIPMIRRVCMQALKSEASRVIACVDDERIAKALEGLEGVSVCMTSPEAPSGTDRIAQMLRKESLPPDTCVVNIQGDEPMIDPAHINRVASLLEEKGADMATLCFPIGNAHDLFDPSCVKVVMNAQGFAMYFSRAPIPYERDNFMHDRPSSFRHYHHVGIYSYRAATVLKFSAMEQCECERAESLEQLRVLNAGMTIAVGVIDNPPETGIDTPEDLERVNAALASREDVI